MYALRFDMRAPVFGAPARELYQAALDMAAFADANGGVAVGICEHHASPDGYLPAPLLLASAVAARTSRIPIRIVAVLATLHDPVQLAEEMAVLDLISGGRTSFVLGLGYREEEFDLYGISMAERVVRLEAAVEVIRAAFRGEPIPGRDPSLRITPAPLTRGGPGLALGGGTKAAARRAARLRLGLVTEAPGLTEAYRAACAELGVEPGVCHEAPARTVTVAFVDRDPDAAWARLGRHLLHDARAYAAWNARAGKRLDAITSAETVEELRAAGHPYRVFTPDEAVEHIRAFGPLNVAPLCGGTPPELGWATLHTIVHDVLPRLAPAPTA